MMVALWSQFLPPCTSAIINEKAELALGRGAPFGSSALARLSFLDSVCGMPYGTGILAGAPQPN